MSANVRLLTEDDRRFAVVYVDDQSEHARMEATRRDFVANVSHELKTPVGAMGVLAEALLASTDDPETVRRFAEMMVTESNRLANMVGELIELSRLQGAEPLPDLGAVDVDTVVGEALSRYKVAADNADIAITTDAPTGFGVLGDQPCWSPRWPTWCRTQSPTRPRVSGVDQPAQTRRQRRDRGHRPWHRHRARPTRSGSSNDSSASTRRGPGPPAAPGSGWPSSSTWRPITTDPSGCGVGRYRVDVHFVDPGATPTPGRPTVGRTRGG